MENLKSQIRFVQEIEVKEIIENAEEQAKKIVKETKENAEKIKNQKTREISAELKEKEDAELALAKMEGKKKISNLKFQLLEEALAKSQEKLREIAASEKPVYRESLEKLVVEAAAKLRGTEFEVLANSRDKKLVKEKLKELERKASKLKGTAVTLRIGEETLNASGGVVVQTMDKKQVFNNTLEGRLAKVRQELFGKVFASLFEGAEG